MVEGKDITGVVNGFATLVKDVIRYIISSVKEYFIALIVIFLLVSGIGMAYIYRAPLYYESEMVCEFNTLSKKAYGEMVERLNVLAQTRSYDALADNLHIPIDNAKEIVSIEGHNIQGSLLREDATPDKDPMYFKVIATTNKVYPIVEPALLTYLNSNSPYRREMNRKENAKVNKKIDFLNGDISLVDSILTGYNVLIRNTNFHSDTSFRTSAIPSLLTYKRQLEDALVAEEWGREELKAPVQILYGFMPADTPHNERQKKVLMSLLSAAIISVVAVVFFRLVKRSTISASS